MNNNEPTILIFDAHLDLAMNALEWNRDLTRPLEEIRAREQDLTDKPDRGRGTVSLPEMRRGGVRLCVATQIARYVKPKNPIPGWHSPAQAWAQSQGQLAWYRAMEAIGEMTQIRTATDLEPYLPLANITGAALAQGSIGYILSLEGADSLMTMKHLDRSYADGLRALGPAHYGPGTYAFGTDADAPLSAAGLELLDEMGRLNLILDATHLCDTAFWQAIDRYRGPIWASHSNCRALVPHQRQFSDEQLKALISRGAVIGAPLDAWMMFPGWVRRQTTPESAQLKLVAAIDHIERVCQLAGDARHAGIGSDLDGAFGFEQTPMDVQSITALQRIPVLLRERGFSETDTRLVAHGNFLRFLQEALPKD